MVSVSFSDNRTIYNKLIQIEKRIENIEKKEHILPPPPEKPDEKPKEQPGEQSENTDQGQFPLPGSSIPFLFSDCLACKSSKPPVSDDCDNCLSVSVSSPFHYFPCSAVSVKCESGAKKLKISDSYEMFIIKNDFVISCQKGNWVFVVNNEEKKVDTISCLSK